MRYNKNMENSTPISKPYYLEVSTGFAIPHAPDPANPNHFPPPESWGPMPGTETDEEIIWTTNPTKTLCERVLDLHPGASLCVTRQDFGIESTPVIYVGTESHYCYRLVLTDDIRGVIENVVNEANFNPAQTITAVVKSGMVVGIVVGHGLLELMADGKILLCVLDADDERTHDSASSRLSVDGVMITAPDHPYAYGPD